MEMNCRAVAAAVNGTILNTGNDEGPIRRLVIDSRQAGPQDFFIPLAGEHTDGHQFIAKAAQNGAIGCFIHDTEKASAPVGMFVIAVPDTLKALQLLSAVYRSMFTLPVIGVTGSVGKTTTKDLIAAVLSSHYKTLKTEGNLNNQIGLPLMLSKLDSSIQAAVLEMGMSGLGEIALLATLAQPSIGVITNIGESHLEMLGSREKIAQAKSELLLRLPPEGVAIVNADEPLIVPHLQNLQCQVMTFGFSSAATIRCSDVISSGAEKTIVIEQAGHAPLKLISPLAGKHNIYNLLAAVGVGRWLHLIDEEIESGMKQLQVSAMRLEMIQLPEGYYVINDAYNASPTSMVAALDVLMEKAGAAGKIAILGDMLELGMQEVEGHCHVGRMAAQSNLKALLVIGNRAVWIARAAEDAGMPKECILRCDSHVQAAAQVKAIASKGDYVLLKGSRGMRMEEVLYALRRETT